MCDCGIDVIHEGNKLWCTTCGRSHGTKVVWVSSFTNPQHFKFRYVYDRRKRFVKYLRSFNDTALNANLESILQCFSVLEMTWSMTACKRKYFFSKNTVLRFIIEYLGIQTRATVKPLKDTERIKPQVTCMREALATTTFW